MPDFTNVLEPPPPPPQHPSPPPSLLISCSSHNAVDANSKSAPQSNNRDCDPKLQYPNPDLQFSNQNNESHCKSDSTMENPDSDLSSEPDLRIVLREDKFKWQCSGENGARVRQRGIERLVNTKKSLDDIVKDWVTRRVKFGVPEQRCFLPFLVQAPKLVECPVCLDLIFPGEDIMCSVRGCQVVVHQRCAKEKLHFSSTKLFKCPQHVCFVCNKMNHIWRCVKCLIASHDKCAAFPEHVVHLTSHPGQVICWKHHADWRLQTEVIFIHCSSE